MTGIFLGNGHVSVCAYILNICFCTGHVDHVPIVMAPRLASAAVLGLIAIALLCNVPASEALREGVQEGKAIGQKATCFARQRTNEECGLIPMVAQTARSSGRPGFLKGICSKLAKLLC